MRALSKMRWPRFHLVTSLPSLPMASHHKKQEYMTMPTSSCESSRRESLMSEEKYDSRKSSMVDGDHDAGLGQDQPVYHVFGKGMKLFVVCLVSAVAALSGLSTYMYFPAQNVLGDDLGISREVINLSITTYILAQGIGPSIWGPLADNQGRRVVLMYTLTIFIVANIILALSVNGPMLMVFRVLQALGSASTIALGAGVIADISLPGERGGYLGWFSGVRQFSLAIGPVIGGILAEYLGWRSIFWFLVGFSSLSVLLVFLLLPETLRRIAGDGSTTLSSWVQRPLLWSVIRREKRPLNEEMIKALQPEIKPATPLTIKVFFGPLLFLLEKDVFCALLFGSCVYTAWSMMVAGTTSLFSGHYGFNTLEIGLCFLANGLGCMLGSFLAGNSLDYDFYREARLWQHERSIPFSSPILSKIIPASFPLEHARLSRGPMYCAVATLSILIFGWSLTTHEDHHAASTAHWIAPLLAQFACGWSATSVLTSNSALIVDLYPGKSASASAVMNLSRSLMAAGGVAAIDPLLEELGAGWTSVVLAGLLLAGMFAYVAHARWGPQWREARERRLDTHGM